MIPIETSTLVHPIQMDMALRTMPAFSGLSTSERGAIAYLEDEASQADKDEVAEVFAGYGQMAVAIDTGSILADDADIATITATAGAGDLFIRFDVWDSEYDHAIDNVVVAVVGGEADYIFKTALAERYTIFAYGDVSYEMGSVEVVAHE